MVGALSLEAHLAQASINCHSAQLRHGPALLKSTTTSRTSVAARYTTPSHIGPCSLAASDARFPAQATWFLKTPSTLFHWSLRFWPSTPQCFPPPPPSTGPW